MNDISVKVRYWQYSHGYERDYENNPVQVIQLAFGNIQSEKDASEELDALSNFRVSFTQWGFNFLTLNSNMALTTHLDRERKRRNQTPRNA